MLVSFEHNFTILQTNLSAPSSPRGLAVIEKNSTSMTVLWELPTENRECVHHYRVCYKLLNLFKWVSEVPEICIETSNTSVIITELEPCATFRIRVSAVTELGEYSIDSVEQETTEFAGTCHIFGIIRFHTFLIHAF